MMKIHQPESGFSLIEILIALFVFAIGILTVAGLQIVSKRTNYEAVQRTTATYLAYDIIERMRANPRKLGVYVDDTLGAARATPAVNCTTTSCDAAELAEFDVWQWQQAINGVAELSAGASTGGLVNPTGCIEGLGAGGQGVYTVTIAWEGVTELNNVNPSDCGNGKYGANNELRRILQVNMYIAP